MTCPSAPDWIFGFWTGENPMTANRTRCWATFARTGLRPILVTGENLDEWIVPGHPLHPAYALLSPVHRSDYLRSYFMFHHGGGYADIKTQTGSWLQSVDRLRRSERLIGAGYREIRGGVVHLDRSIVNGSAHVLEHAVPPLFGQATSFVMRAMRPVLIGNCAFYFKRHSVFARRWLAEAERRLDMVMDDLRRHPPSEPRDRQGSDSGYPLPWPFIMGEIFHPLALIYSSRLLRSLPRPDFTNYQ